MIGYTGMDGMSVGHTGVDGVSISHKSDLGPFSQAFVRATCLGDLNEYYSLHCRYPVSTNTKRATGSSYLIRTVDSEDNAVYRISRDRNASAESCHPLLGESVESEPIFFDRYTDCFRAYQQPIPRPNILVSILTDYLNYKVYCVGQEQDGGVRYYVPHNHSSYLMLHRHGGPRKGYAASQQYHELLGSAFCIGPAMVPVGDRMTAKYATTLSTILSRKKSLTLPTVCVGLIVSFVDALDCLVLCGHYWLYEKREGR